MTSISTLSMSTMLQQSILTMQNQLRDASVEVSTGRYVDVGLTLGAGTGQSISLRDQQSRIQAISQANGNVTTRLSATSAALGTILTTAQDFLSSLVETTSSASSSSAAQQTAQDDLQSLVGALNTSINGEFIFAGTHTQTAPITDYFGTSAPNKAAFDTAFQSTFGFAQSDPSAANITDSQMQSFLDTSVAPQFTGSEWAANWSSASSTNISSQISTTESISTSVNANDPGFQDLAQAYTIVTELAGSSLSQTAMQTVITTATSLMSQAVQDITNLQASIGQAQAQVSGAGAQMSVQMDVLTTGIENLEDVDPYSATTQVTQLQTQIEASYELTNKLQNLSLVNYIT